MISTHKKLFILLLILILSVLIISYFLFGKNLIYPLRASEVLTIYNIDSRGADGSKGTVMPIRTVRWKTLPVLIYNKAELPYFQNVVDEWNQAMGQEVFKIGGSDSPIMIEVDQQASPVGLEKYQYKNHLFEKIQIIVNPEPNKYEKINVYSSKDILKDKLGHALGFFGHTTSDVGGVMDIDHTKSNTIITPFVISVLKELYKLPVGTRGVVKSDLKWAVRKYTIDPRNAQYTFGTIGTIEQFKEKGKSPEPELPTRTIRWRSLPVAVYDKDNLVPDLQNIINEWNQAMDREVFKIGGLDSPIVIKGDAKRPPVELVIWTPKKNYLLYKVEIINNPEWVTSSRIRHQLGHALGFFGHTTDDSDGVMDPDYDKEKVISPLVVSVLKELYKLPPGIRIVDKFGRTNEDVLKVRRAVKKYNIDPRSNNKEQSEVIRTIRWREFPIPIYNKANISNLQNIINEWNQAMDREVFKIGGLDSSIIIETDVNLTPSLYPKFEVNAENYLLTRFGIKVSSIDPNLSYLRHQLGHALGFFGHTNDIEDPNGIMNTDHTKINTVISPFVVSILKELYYLPPAVLIAY